jgi:hypothetical protein
MEAASRLKAAAGPAVANAPPASHKPPFCPKYDILDQACLVIGITFLGHADPW